MTRHGSDLLRFVVALLDGYYYYNALTWYQKVQKWNNKFDWAFPPALRPLIVCYFNCCWHVPCVGRRKEMGNLIKGTPCRNQPTFHPSTESNPSSFLSKRFVSSEKRKINSIQFTCNNQLSYKDQSCLVSLSLV